MYLALPVFIYFLAVREKNGLTNRVKRILQQQGYFQFFSLLINSLGTIMSYTILT